MNGDESVFYANNSHLEEEKAIRLFSRPGLDIGKSSPIGKGYQSEEAPIGFYTVGETIKVWGGVRAFLRGVWGVLLAPAVFVLPELGLIGMGGPVMATLISALRNIK